MSLPNRIPRNPVDAPIEPDCKCIKCCILDEYGERIDVERISYVGGTILYDGCPIEEIYPDALWENEVEGCTAKNKD